MAHMLTYFCFVLWRNAHKCYARVHEHHQGELCVCQITELFGLAPSTVSKHLSILFQAGLVVSRKDGRWIYYKLPGKDAPVEVLDTLKWIEKALASSPAVLEDSKQLKKILKQDPAELCKRQCSK